MSLYAVCTPALIVGLLEFDILFNFRHGCQMDSDSL